MSRWKLIDKYDIYKYGTYIASNAALILGKKTKTINKLYEKLPIKDRNEINITTNEICELLDKGPNSYLKDIYNDLEYKILKRELINDKNKIKEYIKTNYML